MPKGIYKRTKQMKTGKNPNSRNGWKLGNTTGWKGENVSVKRKHIWIKKQKGKASLYKCIDCGEPAKEWSNTDHKYRRVLEDYLPRCVSCHKKYDRDVLGIKLGRHKKILTKK